jgi:suppressor for copper-sensitivity B
MQGDWTLPNARISDYLASYGRYGLPFDAVYGPGAPEGIVLPELLTEATVIEALDRARTAPKVGAR